VPWLPSRWLNDWRYPYGRSPRIVSVELAVLTVVIAMLRISTVHTWSPDKVTFARRTTRVASAGLARRTGHARLT